jgi:hypothetical protein
MNSSSKSIYIPRMDCRHTKETIQELMSAHCIGKVSYVDFTPMRKQRGFNEYNDGTNMMSAFVHFDVMKHYSGGNCVLLPNMASNQTFWDFMLEKKSYKIYVSNTEYWVCLLNTTPVKRTMMNIHQVVDNCRYLETQVEEQADKIQNQDKIIQEQHTKLQEMERTINNIMVAIYGKEVDKFNNSYLFK